MPTNTHTNAPNASYDFDTIAIHAGQEIDVSTGAVNVPIVTSTTFGQKAPGVKFGCEAANSFHLGYEYSRTGNPTRGALERSLAALEHGKYAVTFSSGMSATTAVIHLLKADDHVLCIDDVYGGTQRYFRQTAQPTYGINFDFIPMDSIDEIKKYISPKTRLIWLETPTNPTLKISDIHAIARLAHAHKLLLVVDNTFLTPYFQSPLLLEADLVVHSMSKYINGHSDVVMGCVITNDETLYKKLKFIQNGLGAVPSPFDCYLVLRGIKTLHVRMERHAKNAQAVAEFLQNHAKIEKVIYPGLKSHLNHALAQKQMKGFGGMISIYVKGNKKNTEQFLSHLHVFTCAESLGAVESLAESPAIMTHASVPEEIRKKLGIADNFVRLSVGIESAKDLIHDLDQALNAMTSMSEKKTEIKTILSPTKRQRSD